MRRFSDPKEEKVLISVRTNASRANYEIKNETTTMLSIKDALELRNIANKIREDSLAFQDTADCLKNKLRAIWNQSIDFIQRIENEYKAKLLESLIQIDASFIKTKDTRNKEFILSIDESKFHELKDIRARNYFLTLRCIYRINYIYENFYEEGSAIPNPFSDTFKEFLFFDDNFKSGKFINLIVQEFFSLSIYAYELGKVCGIRVGAPLSKEVRFYRSEQAWKKQKVLQTIKIVRASKGLNPEAIEALEELEDIFDPYGENVLVERIKKIIPNLSPKSNCKSIKSVINDNIKLFDALLDEYKEGLGSPIEKNGRCLTYMKNLNAQGLADLIKKWNLFAEIKSQIKNPSKTDRLNDAS